VQSGGTVLESWELKPAVWADGTGADITLTAVPANYTEGMSAQLNVRLRKGHYNGYHCSVGSRYKFRFLIL
ncbi:MAG: hypothetical protein IIX90_03500, partial [Clostridia bacterium]|nr:hypothetical protein [Clostridia bacterium]